MNEARAYVYANVKEQRRARRLGLTLIELLVAIALAAGLMVAMTGFLREIQQTLRLSQTKEARQWPLAFHRMVRNDLALARTLHAIDDRIVMSGVFASTSQFAKSTSMIQYKCHQLGDETFALVRIDDQGSELVALGPRRLVIERLDNAGMPQPLPPIAGPVPRQLRVWVYEADLAEATFTHDIVLW